MKEQLTSESHGRCLIEKESYLLSDVGRDHYQGLRGGVPGYYITTGKFSGVFRSRDSGGDVVNPGNNLYIIGFSSRVTSSDLEEFFSNDGKVTDYHLVKDPQTKESRGFAFVTMETNEYAKRCIKHLNRTVLEGRLVTEEKISF
ncbi:Serine/arginine-rich splicing factor SR45a [Heracleum sosnowskyi]|uniref:Serine/arginine-rich splicing factor SR45a n=1 Tax=Heracleum sosnowskyi TaxID=360622 RepID=A0AAD8MM44_9APIA|nr:Serine/arginine-rich splicing factor SR45a [Heracleum sosnowskyi]